VASFSYAGLQILVTANMRKFGPDVRREAVRVGTQAGAEISGRLSRSFSTLGRALAPVAKTAANVLGVGAAAVGAFGVASFRTAARVGEMDASLRALAKANRVSYPEMQRQVRAIRAQGIEAGVAQDVVAQFTRNQLKLADSSKLARVAQDAAVISGRNSSEVTADLIHGITTQNSLVLRNAGVNVQAGQAIAAYAKAQGKSVQQLTNAERSQAVLNAVLAEGRNVAGAYAAAMEEPGKVLRSFPRLIDDIKLSVGQGLVQAFGPLILNAYKLTKEFSAAIAEGGKLRPIFDAIGQAVTRVVRPFTAMTERARAFIKAIPPGQVKAIADGIRRFGPAGLAAGAGLAAFAGKNILGNVRALQPVLAGLAPVVDQLKGAFSALPLPAKLAVGAFALLMAVSPEFRKAVFEVVAVLLDGLKPVLAEIVRAVRSLVPFVVNLARALGPVLAAVLRGVLVPVLKVLAAVLKVIAPIITPLTYAWLAWKAATAAQAAALAISNAAATVAAVKTIAMSVATKAAAAAQWLLNAAMAANPIGLVIVAIAALAAAFIFLWTRSSAFRSFWIGLWQGILTAVRFVWNWVKSNWPLLLGILSGPIGLAAVLILRHWSTIRSWTATTWNFIRNTITAALNIIRGAVAAAWNVTIGPIFNRIRQGAAAVGRAFEGMRRIVGQAMNGLRDAVRAPLRWTAFSVINPFLRGANKLLGKIGLSIPLIPSFHAGGRIPGYGGGDIRPAWLEPGEAVVRKELARRPDFQAWARQHRIPGFQQGGLVGPAPMWNPIDWGKGLLGKAGGIAFGALNKIKDLADPVMKLIRFAAFEAFKLGVKPIRKLAEGAAAASVPPHFWRQVVGKLGLKAIDGLVNFISGKVEPEYGGGPGVAALAAEVMRKFPGLSVTSALRPGDPGYHGKGWARDLGGPVGLMNRAGAWMQQTMTNWLLEGIHNPSLSVKNYKRVPSGFWGGEWPAHADHIHMAADPGKGGGGPSFSGGGMALRAIVDRIARGFGVGWAVNLALQRLRVESNFVRNAVNRWDINWQNGTPSVGIAQIIGPTFAAYSGPYRTRGPFLYGVSLDDVAQVYTMFNYSISRYGKSGLSRAWGGTQGYASGGVVSEPVLGLGLRTGTPYTFAERGPELVSPLRQGTSWDPAAPGQQRRQITVNVYPQQGQSEEEIAAAVSRRLGWAIRTGRTV
jgi:hypothetical protein